MSARRAPWLLVATVPAGALRARLARSLLVMSVLAGVLAIALPETARSAFPGVNGSIAFTSDRDGNNEIYAIAPDGTETNLTNDPADDAGPAWSPDGLTIVFMRDYQLYTMRADGSNPQQVADIPGGPQEPAWSPDGSQIAFEAYTPDGGFDIYVINRDGTGLTNLTNTSSIQGAFPNEYRPDWSSDGNQILFTSDRDGTFPGEIAHTYVLDLNDHSQRKLTDDPNAVWSPDGTKIAFPRYRNGGPYADIYVASVADLAHPTQLTDDPSVNYYPRWSPDGEKIVFSSGRSGNYQLYVVPSDHLAPATRLTLDLGADYAPDWQPLPAPDTTAPDIVIPPAIQAEATSPAGAVVTYVATATDPDDAVASFGCVPASGSTFPLGATTVTCSATDAHGNNATASFQVTVSDTTPPVISGVPPYITVPAGPLGDAVVTYAVPTAVDLVDGSVPVVCSPPSGATFQLGQTTVTCSAGDSHGNTAQVSFSVSVQAADLALSKTVDDATPLVGADVTFTLAVTNNGPDDANAVEVTDGLPSGLTFVSATPAMTYEASTGIWSVGSVPNGATVRLEIVATVSGNAPVDNSASITAADQPDLDPTNDTATVTVTPVGADLSLTKVVDDPTPVVGTNVTFTLTVTNGGPELATGVAVSDPLRAGLTFVSAHPSTAYDETTGVWSVGDVASGATASLEIEATVMGAAAVVNRAEVTASDQADPDSTPRNGATTHEDDDASVTVTGRLVADLSLTKSVNDAAPPVGDVIFFTLTVTNTGPHAASGVVVTDHLPQGYTYIQHSGPGTYDPATGAWTVGNVSAGGTASLFVDVRVPGTPFVPATNYAEVTASDQGDPDSTPNNASTNEDDDASVTVTPEPAVSDLSLDMSVDNPNPNLGDQVRLTLTITNDGPDRATGVRVALVLRPGLTYVSDDSPSFTFPSWNVGDLGANPGSNTRTVQVFVAVTGTAAQVPYAEIVASDAVDPDSTPSNASTTEDDDASVTIVANSLVADLSLAMSVNDPTPFVGANVTITLTATNAGPQDAIASVGYRVPAGLTYVSDDGAGAYSVGGGTWAFQLPHSSGASLRITARVNGTAPVVNYAEVTFSSRPDPDSTPANASTTEDDDDSITVVGRPISDLSLSKTVDDPTPVVGHNVTFTLTVTNSGPSATGFAVTDQLSPGLDYVSSSGDGTYASGTWAVNDLPASSSATLRIVARVTGTAPVVNYAEVTFSSHPDPDSTPRNGSTTEDDDDGVTVTGQSYADLALTKTVDDPMPTVGGRVRFTLTISNAGPYDATGVVVKDLLPAGLVVVAHTGGTTYVPATGLWTVGTVPRGSRELEIVATVTGLTPVTNYAEVTASALFDPDSTPNDHSTTDDDDATATVTGQPLVDLALDASVSDTTPAIGVDFTITLTLTSQDTDQATGVAVFEIMPSTLQFVSANASQGSYNAPIGGWTVGTVGPGSSATLILTVKHRGGTLASLTNYAEIAAADQDDPDSIVNNRSTTEDDDAPVTMVPETPRCNGLVATRIGTIDDDTNASLPSTAGNDVAVLFAGNDVWDAGGGNDTVCAGAGNDVIQGNTGTDNLLGEKGDDQLSAGPGNDTVRGGDGNDTLSGDDGTDTLLGELGDDLLTGGPGRDNLQGGDGNDGLSGEDDNDTLTGGIGNDTLDGGPGNDYGSGGNGNDSLVGDFGNDQLFGDSGNDGFSGGSGSDDCTGGAGTDFYLAAGTAGCERPVGIP